MQVSSNYTGRTTDLMISSTFDGKWTWDFPSYVVTGIQKLAQIFVVRFFTAENSKLMDPNDGTLFAENIYKLQSIDTATVIHYINVSTRQTLEQMQDEEVESDPDDEKITDLSAYDISYDISAGILSVYFSLETEAGTDYNFILPVKLPI